MKKLALLIFLIYAMLPACADKEPTTDYLEKPAKPLRLLGSTVCI